MSDAQCLSPGSVSQFRILPALAALLDPVGEPGLHLGFNPSDGADADLDSARCNAAESRRTTFSKEI